ncbi:hypothetical protein [Hwanghaeella sp.]|uniref:hypothetical protein n=1 Tax=Hwanghaeella sp. TaxID=2605943 RepID=UPI003CCB8DE5
MSLSRFESRFVRLEQDYPTGMTAPAVLQRALAMLADLAADTLETDAERARILMTGAALRIETLFRDWPDVVAPLTEWRRDITLFPADDGMALRCRAIRQAESRIRSIVEEAPPPTGDELPYRSSSMSQ